MQIISFINQKGGVGKTTTTQNLAIGLAQKGFKVGLIDVDEQPGNLTFSFFGTRTDYPVTLTQILEAVVDQKDNIKLDPLHFTPTAFANLSILPCNGAVNLYLEKAVIDPAKVIKNILPDQGFDYILIDTPGNMSKATLNALAASDKVLIVSQPSILSLAGMVGIVQDIEEIKSSINPKITLLGILLSMIKSNTKTTKEALKTIKEDSQLSQYLFKTQIPFVQEVDNTQNDIISGILKTIFQKKSANIGMYYSELVNEFIQKTN